MNEWELAAYLFTFSCKAGKGSWTPTRTCAGASLVFAEEAYSLTSDIRVARLGTPAGYESTCGCSSKALVTRHPQKSTGPVEDNYTCTSSVYIHCNFHPLDVATFIFLH